MSAAPPRPLPLRVRLKFLSGFGTWFGVGLFAIGLLFLLFYWIVTYASRQFRPDDPRVAALVTKVTFTGSSNGKSRGNSRTYDYRYTVDGVTYEAKANSTDRLEGDAVTVQYVPANPSLARIEGLAGQQWGLLLVFVAGFGIPGVLLMCFSATTGMRQIRLIRYGIVADATVVCRDAVGGGHPRELEFTALDGMTYRVAPGKYSGMQEGQRKAVFYQAGLPAEAMLLEHVDRSIRPYLR